MKELNRFRQFLNENEVLDRYDKASKELFDMTWDEVQRENDPRMKQDVHDEVQKDDDLDYIDDVQESKYFAPEFYEVTYTALDGNLVERDFKHFTDKGEAIAFHNSLKDNDEIALAIIDKVYYDPKSFLSGRSEQAYYSNPIHQSFLNSRSGDKRFQEPESLMKFLDRKLKGRNEVGTSLALNEGSINESLEALMSKAKKIQSFVDKQGKEDGYEGGAHSPVGGVLAALKVAGGPGFDGDEKLKGFYTRKLSKAIDTQLQKKYMKGFLNEFDDKSMEDYGDAMKVALGSKKMGSPEDEAQKRFDRLSKDDQTKLMKIKAMMNKENSLKENMPKAIIMRQIRDAEEILDSGEADGMPLDNETEMLVRQELKRLKQMAGGDKKEKTMKFLKSKKSYRENLSLEEIYKDIMEVDEEEEKIRKKYDGMKRPSQDEVNDAFEKFERETHYLNDKPVGEWDAYDMSNWKVILRKGGKIK
jgi:hypothetical protein